MTSRRAFLKLSVGAALPVAASDPPGLRRLGIVVPGTRSADDRPPHEIKALEKLGWIEGKNLKIEWRYTDSDDRVAEAVARELVDAHVDVIWTIGTPATRALQRATSTTPIVTYVSDPVASGFAKSLARPGGNITGIAWSVPENARKIIEALRELVPSARKLSMLRFRGYQESFEIAPLLGKAAADAGIAAELRQVGTIIELEEELKRLKGSLTGAAYVTNDLGTKFDPKALAEIAVRHRVALISDEYYIVEAGALMSYIFYHDDLRGADVIDKLLRGANPATLPFELPSRSALSLNRRTAAVLGISIPGSLLLRADTVVG
jgi:putative ABC transport system substrate-binding protein